MSAQETVAAQAASTRALMASTASKPLRVWFGAASFSEEESLMRSKRIEASQPFKKRNKDRILTSKKRIGSRSREREERRGFPLLG